LSLNNLTALKKLDRVVVHGELKDIVQQAIRRAPVSQQK
jgi:hypothetical protein